MTNVYKLLHPVKYFNDYIGTSSRVDGRTFEEHRDIKLSVNSFQTADASAVVKCGNTSVVCGIQLELASPKAEEPNIGFLVTNVELPPICSSKCKPGPPSDHAQVTSNIIYKMIKNSKCIDFTDLCIVPDKLSWVVYCDMVCLNNDGSLVDACLISLMASLKTLTLPSVTYDLETEEITIDTNIREPLKLKGLPVATSFASYKLAEREVLLTDPIAYEEDMCGGIGSNLVICYTEGLLTGIQKFGGSNISIECQEKLFKIAHKRTKCIEEVIDKCIKIKSEVILYFLF